MVEWPSGEHQQPELSQQLPAVPDSQMSSRMTGPDHKMIQTEVSGGTNSGANNLNRIDRVGIEKPSEKVIPMTGYLQLFVPGPAQIILDSNRILPVTRDSVMEFSPGQHRLEISHTDYPPYIYDFNISSGDTLQYRIDPGARYSWFHCTVYPWGDVYIDEQFVAQTPFFEPVRVRSGLHLLRVENPGFASYRDSISVQGGDTLKLLINLEKDQNFN